MAKSPGKISRRQFGRGAALALAGVPLAGATAALPPPAPTLPQTPKPTTPAEAEVEAKVQRVLAEYGDRLDEAQKTRIRGTIGYHVRMLQSVRAYSLANGDPPATVLRLVSGGRRIAPAQPATQKS